MLSGHAVYDKQLPNELHVSGDGPGAAVLTAVVLPSGYYQYTAAIYNERHIWALWRDMNATAGGRHNACDIVCDVSQAYKAHTAAAQRSRIAAGAYADL